MPFLVWHKISRIEKKKKKSEFTIQLYLLISIKSKFKIKGNKFVSYFSYRWSGSWLILETNI